jgi:hypothetical protein
VSGIRVAPYTSRKKIGVDMTVTGQFLKSRAVMTLLAVFFALMEGIACSRPLGMPAESEVGQTDPHQAPFHGDGGKPANHSEEDAGTENGSQIPFRGHENLPAGTMISVRLKDPISVGDSQGSSTFEAVVLEPVVVEGSTVIPSGAAVSGLVESAHTSKVKANRGYLRLSLASCHIEGVDVPVQTASLFVRQFPVTDASASVIYLEKGRRLTFRLTRPVYLANQRAQSGR